MAGACAVRGTTGVFLGSAEQFVVNRERQIARRLPSAGNTRGSLGGSRPDGLQSQRSTKRTAQRSLPHAQDKRQQAALDDISDSRAGLPSFSASRAGIAALALALIVWAAPGQALEAKKSDPPEEVPEYVQKLLERSKANKAKYDKERLDSYNRRNFGDYFDFVVGSKPGNRPMTETEKKMAEWLKANR